MICDGGIDPLPANLIALGCCVGVMLLSLFLMYVFSFFDYHLFGLGVGEKERLRKSLLLEYKRIGSLLGDEASSMSACVSGYWLCVSMVCDCVWICTGECAFVYGGDFVFKVLISLFISFFLCLLAGELLPKCVTTDKSMARLYYLSGVVCAAKVVLFPVVFLLRRTGYIERRIEVRSNRGISISELTETLEHVEIKSKEDKGILERIVSFGSVSAVEIMRPRVDVVMLDAEDDYEAVMRIIRESEYSRMPVYEKTVDNIKGVLYVKDLLSHINEGKAFKWQELVRKPFFVPESKKIDDLLREFQKKRIHLAVIVDEFGGMAGIVTMEDIIEVIFGDISDEHDAEQRLYTELDKRNFLFEGKLELEDFYKIPGVRKEIFTEAAGDADTVAGMILQIRGDIPQTGDEIEYKGYLFKIVTADSRRVKKIKLRLPSNE